MSARQVLEQGAAVLGVPLQAHQIQQLIDYLALLQKWNRVYNLTAIRDEADMLSHHLLDSLAVVPHLGAGPILDVGSGAGLPGLPIAIAQPSRAVTLLDSIEKKAAFQRQAVAELGLASVSVHIQRVEQWRPAERFPLIISRAFAELAQFALWCGHLLAPGGRLIAMKGVYPEAEIAALAPAFKVEKSLKLDIPGLGAERHLIWIEAL
jgi:16S rRNA (guanine527-N7)-methyltransferase